MPMMNNGANGATPRQGPEEEEPDYELRLNTYIYDYFLKNHHFECAKAMLNGHHNGDMPLKTFSKRDANGGGSMHIDSKDDLDSKLPDDLPLAVVPTDPQGASFLLEWFGLFWDVYFAHQKKAPPASAQAMQYVARTQQESRLRQEQNNNMLRVPGMMSGSMGDYQQLLFRSQQNGMPGDLRQKALQNQNRQFQNPQHVMNLQKQQQMMQQMRRDPSEMDMNGQRPRTPSSGDNAPSPSKRPRIDGHPGMMMQNGRPQQMFDQAHNSPNALLMQGGVPPTNLTNDQYMALQQQPLQVQQKSLDVFNQNLRNNQQRQNMSKPGMPGQGSPMMQPGMDMGAVNAEFYGQNMQMAARGVMPNGNGVPNGGNHALQDYQMQLMLLEQQNKKRLLMARQEQEVPRGPDGQPGMPPGGFVGPAGMSPSGSRSGPSPGPNDQVKRGTPKIAQAGLPGSPMPDGSMPQARGSPAAMALGNGMQGDMFQMKNMNEGMALMGPNGSMMRQPPSSHPNFNGQFTPQQIADMQQRRTGMPNGNWQQGPQGQAPMMQPQPPQQPQQPSQIGTPQQRTNMPPPSGLPTAANGRPGSPAQPAAPPTPSQGNKANPKGKKDPKDRKKPAKKGSTAGTVTAATPSSEAEPPPTPTPSTPITPVHPNSFNGQKNEVQNQTTVSQNPATTAPAVEPPPPETNAMEGYPPDGGDGAFDMTFGNFNSEDHLQGFDFDSFLTGDLMDPDQFTSDFGAEAIGGT